MGNEPRKSLTAAELAEIRRQVSYDPETGIFRWLISKRGPRKAGEIAGSFSRLGYWRIKVDQGCFLAHRLAWAFHYGKMPRGELDHINGNPGDNRISNLREVTRWQNCSNVKGSGVRFEQDRNKWLARIGVRYKQIHLGRFDTEAEARAVYIEACKKYRGEFARAP